MNPQLTQRILISTAACGAVLVLVAYALWGAPAAVGALVGGAVATMNALAMKFLVTMGTTPAEGAADPKFMKGRLSILVGGKVVALMLICWLCITRWGVSFDGFTLGIGAMVLGILIGSKLTPPAPAVAEV